MIGQVDMSKKPYVLLSFDIEEFDIPEEYGQKISESTQIEVSLLGLKSLLNLLEPLDIKVTFFTTANFALQNQILVQEIAKKHEIASHGFYHSSFNVEDLKKSKQVLSAISMQSVSGFRMARLKPVDEQEIVKAGYRYNSSLNPTYIPGRYNHFFKPRTATYTNNLFNIPVSVTPLVRFPLFWLSFKNFPLFIIKLASQVTLNHDAYLSLYFHPWEFADITRFNLPFYIKKSSGKKMLIKLEDYLRWLKRRAEFITFSEFTNKFNQ
jgi:peptidoglycan/xylan/chitin deacetylase (PgdA/CDA1 family)